MKKSKIVILSLLIAIPTILTGCFFKPDNNNNNIVDTKYVEPTSTDTTVSTTGEKIHLNDSSLGEIWITVLDGVNKNLLIDTNFSTDNTFKYYSENGKPASLEGIDISYHNGDIDWKKVKESGVDFAMVRIGGRGYGESGTLFPDEKAIENITNAQNNGIKVGVYFFSQAISTQEAIEEANYVKELLGDIKLDFPVAYDWEIIKDDEARTDNVSAYTTTECARAFCDTIMSYGYIPMIYSPSSELYFKYDLSRLSDVNIWYCEYSNTPSFYYEFSMWQYSKNAVIDGIDGEVDLNMCFTNIADYS